METKEWDILSKEDQLSISGGKWVMVNGKLIWLETSDFDDLENTFLRNVSLRTH